MSELLDLESVVTTDALDMRPPQPADFAAENRALVTLATELALSTPAMLQRVADVTLELCHADSVVISFLDDDQQGFTWHVAAGQWSVYHGHRVPRDASPCGIVHDRDAAQLFSRPERYFAALSLPRPYADEVLVVPIEARGVAIGTLWIVAHDPQRLFDAEDRRKATHMASFAAAASLHAHPDLPLTSAGGQHAAEARRQRQEIEAQLREADRRKDIFLATLAHELRNPLAPVMNSLEIMRRAGGEPLILRDAIATMQRQMTQMVRMVDDLVDVSRIIRDQLELRRARIAIGPVLAGAVEACQPLVSTFDHTLTVDVPPEPLYVDADPARLTQVFGNLLNNACKFTERGGTIVVSARRVDDDVEVSVKDTGVGIAPDQLSEVFEMFAHVDRAVGREQPGLGIGLHLVKRLVELQGGTVRVQSGGRGQGSEFMVRLPLMLEQPQSKPSTPASPAESRRATPRRRILVVDDNQDAAMSLAVLLKVSGHDTEMAADGVEALQKASIYRPDVILLDISLPRMNGYDTCRAMRQQWWGRQAVIVALTGWGQDEDRSKSKSAGFNGHFVKPVDHAALMQFLMETTAE